MQSLIFTAISIFTPILLCIIITVVIIIKRQQHIEVSSDLSSKINQEKLLREANRRLASNPKDPVALQSLGDIYFQNKDFKKAMRTYQMLIEQVGAVTAAKEITLNLNYGIAAMECKNWSAAYTALMLVKGKNVDDVMVSTRLAKIEFMRKNYIKAIGILRGVLKVHVAHHESQMYMGQSLFFLKRYNEAIGHLNYASEAFPDNTELRYMLARCKYEDGKDEVALTLFKELREDSKIGVNACLYAGMLHAKKHIWDEAETDYKIGLKHNNLTTPIITELKYHLARVYCNTNKLNQAIALFQDVQAINPHYKDIASVLLKYKDLSTNRNMQVYLFTPINDFITFAKKILYSYFKHTTIKILDIKTHDYIDIIASLTGKKWTGNIIVRFLRNEGTAGELFIRELYSQIKELHAVRGFCFSPGYYSADALHFIEARPIELIDKNALETILKTIDAREFTTNPINP